MTSPQSDLAARLRKRQEEERQQIEEMTAEQLRRLGRSLSNAAASAQRSIEADIEAATETVRALLIRVWLVPAAAGLSLFLVICGGGWGTMRWLSASIEDRLQTRAILDVDIEQARETLTHLEETTWRVELLEIEGQRFVVLPPGSLIRPRWTVGGRPAVKLSGR